MASAQNEGIKRRRVDTAWIETQRGRAGWSSSSIARSRDTQGMGGIKNLTMDNWRIADPALAAFVRFDAAVGPASTDADDWTAAFLGGGLRIVARSIDDALGFDLPGTQ
jgi:hypothetical protein